MRTAIGFLAVLVSAAVDHAVAHADPAPIELHGIALGMTPGQASDAAHLPCQTPQYSSDLTCKDTADGSDYQAMFSAGDPSIALTIQHSFCSRDPINTILGQTLATFHVPASRAHGDPNGYYVDLDGDNEAVLDADAGTCPSGGKHYVVSVRSNRLIKMSSTKAVQRAKNALH